MEGDDAQFQKDLEEAKRRSLESFKDEQGKWSHCQNTSTDLDSISNSGLFSSLKCSAPIPPFPLPPPLPPNPIGFVLPNANSSSKPWIVPGDLNLYPSGNGNIPTPFSSYMNHSTANFPPVFQQPGLSAFPPRPPSVAPMPANHFFTQPDTTSSGFRRDSGSAMNAVGSNYGFNYGLLQRQSLPQNDSNSNATPQSTEAGQTRRSSFSTLEELSRRYSPRTKNFEAKDDTHCTFREEDLIDLGQNSHQNQKDDGKNILEAFDPLFEKPEDSSSWLSAPQRDASPVIVASDTLKPPPSVDKKKEPVASSSTTTTHTTVQNTSDSTKKDAMMTHEENQEADAPGPANYISLYPNLCHESFDTLQSVKDSESGSSAATLYDAYNQSEYHYAVSLSSETSSFYWHPNESSSHPSEQVLASHSPASGGYVPAESVRQSKHKRRSSTDKMKRRGKLYEDVTILKKVAQNDTELIAFVEMLKDLENTLKTSSKPSFSCIGSPTCESSCWAEGLSLKVIVWPDNLTTDSVTFTCDVTSPLDEVIEHALSKMGVENGGCEDKEYILDDYIFRVKGLDEYLDSQNTLIDYKYVQECIKLDVDVELILVHKPSVHGEKWRETTEKSVDRSICPEEIMPTCYSKVITFIEISKFLEVIDRESDKLNEKLSEFKTTSTPTSVGSYCVNHTPLMQTVKGICVLLGEIQTVEIRKSLQAFTESCEHYNTEVQKLNLIQAPYSTRRTIVGGDLGTHHSYVEIVKDDPFVALKEAVLRSKESVIDSIRMLVEMYSQSFPVSFQMTSSFETTHEGTPNEQRTMSDMLDPFLIRVTALHRMKSDWCAAYVDFFVAVEVFHGTRQMGIRTLPFATLKKMDTLDDHLFFNTVIIDTWVDFDHLPMCILARECRLVFTVYGRKVSENGESLDSVELGWASIQCFDYLGFLTRGNQLLPLYPVGMPQKRLGPAPNSAFSYDLNVPLLTIEFPDFGPLKFPEIPPSNHVARDFSSLDCNTQLQLKDIIEIATFTKIPVEDREVLWEKRHYLHSYPTALPKVLLSAQFWDFASLSELHRMMDSWTRLQPAEALQLLLPCFPDAKVRQTAIGWIDKMTHDELITVLPQLVEALSYETFDLSPLAEYLLEKSLFRFEIAHALFWHLASEVGLGKWGTDSDMCAVQFVKSFNLSDETDPRRRRLELMRNSLMTLCCHKWRTSLVAEFKLIQGLCDVATLVKMAQPSQRNQVLFQELKRLDMQLFGGQIVYTLPFSPSYIVESVDLENCISYNSASVPLKINFRNALPESGLIPILFKQGDDLRQDMLTIQVIRMIERMWLKEGLDLRVVTFSCVPTGFKQGVVEIVPNAETLCKIQADYGVTGAFRNRPISEWLAKMNPSTLDYRRAVDNFTRSCAAYCVLTYILGICDRHNDNIMLTNKGHLFHIDFGKFLGDSQMFGSFKRDRAPFVLTSDMLYVINEGDKESQKFHDFVDLCCQAFRIVRQNGDILSNLFAMMATAGISGVDLQSFSFVQNALLPDCSNVEAAAKFTRFIEDSLSNWFTSVNFFIHSLAQLRFASDSTDNPTTLSFMPKLYTMDHEGRIQSAKILNFQKKYDPEKYYSYSIMVKRRDQNQPSIVNRTYKQFQELYSKLCMNFPMAIRSLKALPKSSGIGRSNVKQVAEKRVTILQSFLESLFRLADEIAHSDLVYTFFHPLLKDECTDLETTPEEVAHQQRLLSPIKIHGSINVCIQYSKGVLVVLVLHAKDLACPSGQPPSAYVKSYLQPDPSRLTKRKTRVVKRSQHPTWMETIEYRLPLDVVRKRTLQLSVCHHDPLQENSFLGGVSINLQGRSLEKENETEKFTLANLTGF